MIYLDNASTTLPLIEVVNEIENAYRNDYFNISAKYSPAKMVGRKFSALKSRLISLLGADGGEIIVTPSATIANNLVMLSNNPKAQTKIIVSAGEHPSVYECAKRLEAQGAKVVFCPLKPSGHVDELKFSEMVDESVGFVSIMHVNNETGAINDIKKLALIAKSKNPNCLVHADGVQAFGKIPVNLSELGVDYYTISGHKINGPKGVGVLWAKSLTKLKPLILGGGQEQNLISGTENYPNFAGFMVAVNLTLNSLDSNFDKVLKTKSDLTRALNSEGIDFKINGDESVSPYILNVSFAGIRGEALLYLLADRGIFVSNGSACSSHKRGNRILEAMGRSREEVDGAVRISFSAQTSYDVTQIAKIIKEEIDKIKH